MKKKKEIIVNAFEHKIKANSFMQGNYEISLQSFIFIKQKWFKTVYEVICPDIMKNYVPYFDGEHATLRDYKLARETLILKTELMVKIIKNIPLERLLEMSEDEINRIKAMITLSN